MKWQGTTLLADFVLHLSYLAVAKLRELLAVALLPPGGWFGIQSYLLTQNPEDSKAWQDSTGEYE